jgi:hypothetical protein
VAKVTFHSAKVRRSEGASNIYLGEVYQVEVKSAKNFCSRTARREGGEMTQTLCANMNKKRVQMVTKYMKKCSTSLPIKEIKMKTTKKKKNC